MEVELDTAVVERTAAAVGGGSSSARLFTAGRWPRPLVTRVVRYTLGSVVASLVSLVAFVLVYGVLGGLSPRQSSVIASLTGMVPAYFLNRNWAWGRRGRSHLLREVIPYLAASVLGLMAAMWSVGAASSHVTTLTADRTLQVTLVALAYAGTYGALWVLKFLFFNVLFAPPRRDAGDGAPA